MTVSTSSNSSRSRRATPGYDWEKERAANTFAACLLMPAAWIRADTKAYSASRLATRYKVSHAAMAYRLANLRLGTAS